MLSVAFKSLILKYPTISKVLLSEIQSIQGTGQRYFKLDKNVFSAGLTVRTILTESARPFDGAQPTSFLKLRSLPQGSLVRCQCTSKWNANLDVQNNVILYKYDNPSYFLNVRLFAFGQLIGWSVLAYFMFQPNLLDIFTTDITTAQYFKDNFWRLASFGASIFIGPSAYLSFYALSSRMIKYVILNKGGRTLTFITYHFVKKKSIINVPVDSVTHRSHRTDVGIYVPLRIKNKPLYFLVEKKGTFVNPELFDRACR